MTVGAIDTTSVPGIWLYILHSHKTMKKTKKKRVIALNETEQALIAPYLIGKKPSDSVFSPKTGMLGMKVRDAVGDFYNKDSYRVAVLRVIEKANRQLPADQQIPTWTPYELRHSAASALSVELGGEAATAQLGHTSATTTAVYLHREIEKGTKIAVDRERHNPFATAEENSDVPHTIPYCPAETDGRAAS